MEYEKFSILAISLGLGLLVGLQREYAENKVAGIRTFSLVTLFGSITGFIATEFNSEWIIPMGALCLAIILAMANYMKLKSKEGSDDFGQTTEVAALLMFAVGAYITRGQLTIGVAIGGMTAILLYLKDSLGGLVDRMSSKDIKAIMQFAAISLIILPVLPNQNFGPYGVLNPREIWWMVVLIVGLSLAGYFIYKIIGKNAGTLSSGILGGLISSTATTATYARMSASTENMGRLAAFIIVTASTVSMMRVLLEVAVVTPQNLKVIAPPFIAEILIMMGLCVWLFFSRQKEETEEIPEPENPAQLKGALIFGALYALIILAVAFAKEFFGENGLFLVSLISGFADVDAITLSLANTLNRGEIEASQAWQFMLLATLSNLVFKGGLATFMGSKQLRRFVLIAFGIGLTAGIALILFWPG